MTPARHDAAKSDELLRLLVETVQDYAIFVLDPNGCVVSWNPGAERIKGYAADEIIGQHFSRFYPPDDIAAGKCERELETARTVGRFEEEGWRLRKDGTTFWANVVITALRNPRGKLVGYAKITRDLTAHRAAEEERAARLRAEDASRLKDAFLARESAAKREAEEARSAFAATLRSIGDAVIATDAHGNVTLMNGVAEQLTGWSEAEARDHPATEVFHIVNEQSRATVESPVDHVLREGVIVGLANHTVLISRSGVETPIDDSGAPIRAESGEIIGVVLVFRNASEEKQALMRRAYLADMTSALATSLDYRATLAGIARLAVPRLADWCRIDLVEEGTSVPNEIAMVHAEARKVDVVRDWIRGHPADADHALGITSVLRTGASAFYPEITDDLLAARVEDASQLELLRTVRPRSAMIVAISTGGPALGAITLAIAESDRHYRQEDLAFAEDLGRRAALAIENARLFEATRVARHAADDANRAKDDFLARVSHELRTPLNAIFGWAQLMIGSGLDPAKRSRGMDAIVRNASAMSKLIEDLLDVSRISSGQLRVDLEPVEIVPVLEAAMDAVRPAADAKQIHIERTFDPGRHLVLGDATRLQQIAWNLLSNAVKFTPAGGRIEVSARLRGSAMEITVQDDGLGIDPEFLPHAFEPFRQADTRKARGGAGLGLGLSITKQLVELHGGHLTAHSGGLGKGATFNVYLPRVERSGTGVRSGLVTKALRQVASDLSGLHVLAVDDEPDARALIETALEQCGARVTTASGVAEALMAFERETPDLVVSDIGMPGEDGYDLIRRVRALPIARGGRVPALALTAYARVEDRMRALSAGYESHLSKPVDPAALTLAVAMLAKARPVQAGPNA
jgi:PAS domain S-box-containing protein